MGLWAASFLSLLSLSGGAKSYIIAGLILALLNAVLKPILIIFTLPIIALTLGLFLIIINAIILYVLSIFFSSLVLDSFIYTMLAGIVIGLVNYIVTFMFERLIDNE